MSTNCPCCGAASAAEILVSLDTNQISVDGHMIKVAPQRAEIAHVLAAAYPRAVERDTMIAKIWGVNEPSNPEQVLQTQVCYLRANLQEIGWTVISRVGTYRIQKIDGPHRNFDGSIDLRFKRPSEAACAA
jgi:DNA-binding winged helix-turn-helix (wHTH) protein